MSVFGNKKSRPRVQTKVNSALGIISKCQMNDLEKDADCSQLIFPHQL